MSKENQVVYVVFTNEGEVHSVGTTWDIANAILEKDISDGEIKGGSVSCGIRIYTDIKDV